MPTTALPVETHDGYIMYEGTLEEPILRFKDCLADARRRKRELRLWTVNLLSKELEAMCDTRNVQTKDIWSLHRDTLPTMPSWLSPNGWDYRGRPWAYIDIPADHPAMDELKIVSVHEPPAAPVAIAVLVDCEHELQYLPNLDVAKSMVAKLYWQYRPPVPCVAIVRGQWTDRVDLTRFSLLKRLPGLSRLPSARGRVKPWKPSSRVGQLSTS